MSTPLTTVVVDFATADLEPKADSYVLAEPTADLITPDDVLLDGPVRIDVDELTGMGSRPLLPTDTAGVRPSGWKWRFTVVIGNKRASFTALLPATPNPAHLTDLMPDGFQV